MISRLRAAFPTFWASHRAKIALTAFCILVALFDTFWKSLSIIAAAALSIAIVPWVVGLLEKLSVPGGFELVFAKAEQKLDATPTVPDQKDIDAFSNLSGSDPNLAIAFLRIQIERRLREMYDGLEIQSDPRRTPTLRLMVEALSKRGVLTHEAVSLINDLNPVMNQAAHGIHLNDEATNFALQYGPKILSMLKSPADQAANLPV